MYGNIGPRVLGKDWDNGKENGNYEILVYLGLYPESESSSPDSSDDPSCAKPELICKMREAHCTTFPLCIIFSNLRRLP